MNVEKKLRQKIKNLKQELSRLNSKLKLRDNVIARQALEISKLKAKIERLEKRE